MSSPRPPSIFGRSVLRSALCYLAVGPLAGTVVFLALMTSAQPGEFAIPLSELPFLIFGAYVAGAVPAASTGVAIALLDFDRPQDYAASAVIGAILTAVCMHMTLGDSALRQGIFWRSSATIWSGSLQCALWGGLSGCLTTWMLRSSLRRPSDGIERAGGWHVPSDRH